MTGLRGNNMGMDFSKPEQQDGSKNQWIKNTHEALDDVEELRQEIPAEYVRTEPFDPPELVDYYNRLVHRFASRVRPKKNALGAHLVLDQGHDPQESLWTQQITTVNVPKDGETVDVGQSNVHGEIDISDALNKVDWEAEPLRLSNLRDWNQKQVKVDVCYFVPGVGTDETTVRKSIYLPVYALDGVVDQLNECLEDLGWLPDASEKEIESEVLR